MTSAERNIVNSIRKNGYIQVSTRDSLKWKRRKKLQELEARKVVKLTESYSLSYLNYVAGENFDNEC